MSKIRVLLVEDNLADAKLTTKLLSKCEGMSKEQIVVAEDGEEAYRLLTQDKEQVFNLVFLDLNIPKINGLELLEMIRAHEEITYTPVIILSSSIAKLDMEKAFDLNVNAYLKKPVDLIEYQELMKKIEGFWFSACKLANLSDLDE